MNTKQNSMNVAQAQAFAMSAAFRTVTNLADQTKRADLARLAMVKGGAK
jgi:hypothetical protein